MTHRPGLGVQFHGMWSAYTDSERASVLDIIAAAGIRTVRLDVSWAMLQPSGRQRFDPWGVAFTDRVIGMCRDRGIAVLVTLWLTPPWANRGRGERALPEDPADYARVARWMAGRHAGAVMGWEVWNEPNSTDFLADADPSGYAALLRAAYPAFHAGDPDAAVVFGGVQYNDDAWIDRAYAAGVRGHFDVMATHPYPAVADQSPTANDDATIWAFAHAAAVRRLMVRHGDGDKPLWFTEIGWSTHDNPPGTPHWARGVTEEMQAAHLLATIEVISTGMPYVERMFWYAERDSPAHGSIHNQNFGLLRADHSAKPILTQIQRWHTRAE